MLVKYYETILVDTVIKWEVLKVSESTYDSRCGFMKVRN